LGSDGQTRDDVSRFFAERTRKPVRDCGSACETHE
jgi:hypothetical protein